MYNFASVNVRFRVVTSLLSFIHPNMSRISFPYAYIIYKILSGSEGIILGRII